MFQYVEAVMFVVFNVVLLFLFQAAPKYQCAYVFIRLLLFCQQKEHIVYIVQSICIGFLTELAIGCLQLNNVVLFSLIAKCNTIRHIRQGSGT